MNIQSFSTNKIYAIFHLNLNFSLVDSQEHPKIIKTCYWPLLKLLEKNNKIKIGIECSGNTLSTINQIDKEFINKLKQFIKKGQIDFLASGLEQIISPLVPYQITLDNLRYGNNIYYQILGIKPKIAFLNEQTFSDGVIDLYIESGFKAVVIDWDNLPDQSKKINTPYHPAEIKTKTGSKILGIFISSIAMQQFRKAIFGELTQKQYLKWLKDILKKNSSQFFPIYGDDVEIYNYKPNSLNIRLIKKDQDDFKTMVNLLNKLLDLKYALVLPSELLLSKHQSLPINITDPSQTIRTKKQEKYNATRWAVCGRGNGKINRLCYRIHQKLNVSKNNTNHELLNKELITLWGSDFRTHTTEEKYQHLQNRLGWLSKEVKISNKSQELPIFNEDINPSNLRKIDHLETNAVKIKFWPQKGGVIEHLSFPKISNKPLCGTLHQGYYQQSSLQADWFTGHSIIRLKDNNTLTDLDRTEVFAPKNLDAYTEKIPVYVKLKMGFGEVVKKYSIYIDEPKIDIEKYFMFYNLEPLSFRIFNLTLNPEAFNLDTLFLATVNGGRSPEIFSLKNSQINQDEPVNLKISSHGCQGATTGWIAMGDAKKGLAVIYDPAENYSVPLIHFEKIDDTFFGRISTSIAESDETASHFYRGKFKFKATILGFKNIEEIL